LVDAQYPSYHSASSLRSRPSLVLAGRALAVGGEPQWRHRHHHRQRV